MDKFDFDQIIERQGTGAEKWDGRENIFGSEDLLPMWVADMDFASPPEVVTALTARAAHGIYGYPLRGDGFYQAAIDWLKRRHGWNVNRDWINSAPGVVSAISIALQAFTSPGDKVLIQPPVYPGFFSAVQKSGRNLVLNPLRQEGRRYVIDFADLEAKLASGVKLFVLCSPHNPVGRVWTKEELVTLGELCLKHGTLVVADEIHSDLVFLRKRHIPFASLSPEFAAIAVTCVSPSKTFNVAGLATALTVIAESRMRARYESVLKAMHVEECNIFGITALEAAYRHGEAWLDSLLIYLETNADFLVSFLRQRNCGIEVEKPEATYLAWLDCRSLGLKGANLPEFFASKAKVGLSDGRRFGEQGFMRLNFACPRALLEEGLERIEAAIKLK
ncbi:MAG: pyridoxal phosphate-dependent aminotransferase [Firmicutes bacterium]|nr:pyridoxal phosphate-dependent aminotransferase [Bacillota bacterium]